MSFYGNPACVMYTVLRPTNISNRHLTTKKLNPAKTNW